MKDYEKFIVDKIIEFYKLFNLKYEHKDNYSDWLIQYYNYRLRYIVQHPRKILKSNEVIVKINSHQNKEAIEIIIAKIESGVNLNSHQSLKLIDTEFDDDLFNDWGIHHLHLSNNPHPINAYFSERTNDNLYIRFTQEEAYLIDIMPHNNYTKKSLLEIVQVNWSHLMKDVGITFYPDYNEEEIKILRKKGYTGGININGKGYMLLGHGYASSGINNMSVRLSHNLIRWIGVNMHLKESDSKEFYKGIINYLGLV